MFHTLHSLDKFSVEKWLVVIPTSPEETITIGPSVKMPTRPLKVVEVQPSVVACFALALEVPFTMMVILTEAGAFNVQDPPHSFV